MAKPIVLLIDDEAELLEDSLYQNIRSHFPNFECITCQTTIEAKVLCRLLDAEAREIVLFVVDEVMQGSPEMGTALTAFLDQSHPRARKILLSGQASTEIGIRGLNGTGVDKVVQKRQVMQSQSLLFTCIEELLLEYRKDSGLVLSIKDGDSREIVVRTAQTAYEIQQASKLIFLVYNDVEKRFRPGTLSQECLTARAQWDEHDFAPNGKIVPTTKHIVAMKDAACVGCARLYVAEGPLDGLTLAGGGRRPTLRAGKWIIHPHYRDALLPMETNLLEGVRFRSPMAISLLLLSLVAAKYEFKESIIYLTCLPKIEALYVKMGFKRFGQPFEHATLYGDKEDELLGKYIGMVIDIDEVISAYIAIRDGLRPNDLGLSMLLCRWLIEPLQSPQLPKLITKFRTPWMRYGINMIDAS